MGRRGAGAQRSVAAWWRSAAQQGGGAYRQRPGADHRQGVAASGRRDPPAGRGSIGVGDHRQGVAASGRRDPPGRAWQHRGGDPPAAAGSRSPAGRGSIGAARSPRQQGGQGLEAAKSSRAKDESPTGILSTHVHVAAEKNFFTPRRGVILAEKRPLPARGRKPCYDFCVGRERPPAKQKLHSADHGAERITP